MSDAKQYLSVEEVADLLGVNYQLIYRLVRGGDIPAIRLGRVYRIERADLDAYLERRKTRPEETHPCAVCGKLYRSASSLAGTCELCDAHICIDCWTRKGERRCRAHAQAEASKPNQTNHNGRKQGGR